jgi:hypothetical protein
MGAQGKLTFRGGRLSFLRESFSRPYGCIIYGFLVPGFAAGFFRAGLATFFLASPSLPPISVKASVELNGNCLTEV